MPQKRKTKAKSQRSRSRSTSQADEVRVGVSPIPGLTLRHVLRGHTESIERIAWSPDGLLLATPSRDRTIRVWNIEHGECVQILEGHTRFGDVAWAPDRQHLGWVRGDGTVRLWNIETGKELLVFKTGASFQNVAWSPDGKKLAVGDFLGKITIIDTATWEKLADISSKSGLSYALTWLSDSETLAVGSLTNSFLQILNTQTKESSKDIKLPERHVYAIAISPLSDVLAVTNGSTVRILDPIAYRPLDAIQAHTNDVTGVSFSQRGELLATKSMDCTVRLWKTDTWQEIARLNESTGNSLFSQIAFSPSAPILVTLAEEDKSIRVWDLDMNVLLKTQARSDSVRYTTGKLVLVGDSGVGKTGLGWRLAYGEFKQHASTHGQQFWVIHQLGTKLPDGTECEAVLWDLAGQHLYRPIHAIFLDNVDLSIVLFDPTNRQEPLKGVQFWLEQLAGKDQLPPCVLVGSRIDRGMAVLSQQELDQFCQRLQITGGYVATSASTGEGLDKLLEVIKSKLPWGQMTTTVTTGTFNRIKKYVLALKEKPDRQEVLISPKELRKQLRLRDRNWHFTDAEMMTAVKHLENHGYICVLRGSNGQEFILLTPELLVGLASSIVLQADKHPRELGALSETDLIQGRYPFPELKDLAEVERQILLDAAVARFLQHNICLRETLGSEALLIFPGLIKQKRPLLDEVETVEDVSYIIRGRVENVYAALVVLLGYTQTFTRVNQWQNQAQYEMGKGEICGFRLIEEREGEIELVLYYSSVIPSYGRKMFQGLFERFLYQRDVEVTRFPPVYCLKNHRQERATVIKRLREDKDFLFCDECGERTSLPEVFKPGSIGSQDSKMLRREESLARIRSTYETYLVRVKSFRRDRAPARCYISCTSQQAMRATELTHDLRDAGVLVLDDKAQIKHGDFIVIIGTPDYKKAWEKSVEPVASDAHLFSKRTSKSGASQYTIVPLLFSGDVSNAFPREQRHLQPGNFRKESHYVVSLFDLVLTLHAIPFSHPAFEPLRASLEKQWMEKLGKLSEETKESVSANPENFKVRGSTAHTDKRFDVALSFPGEYRDFVKEVAGALASELSSERVFYDQFHEAELARFDLDIHLQSIYHDQSELIVIFLCAEYELKEWCGLEWRALRDLIKRRKAALIMPIRFDNTHVEGLFSIDGYINATDREPAEIAEFILQRLKSNLPTGR